MYKQCTLIKYLSENSNMLTTTWLPSKFAIMNKYLKLKNNKGDWEDGWKVVSIGESMSSEELKERERDYLHQREASDI